MTKDRETTFQHAFSRGNVTVGGDKKGEFIPAAKITAFQDRCSLTISYSKVPVTSKTSGDKISAEVDGREVVFYPLEPATQYEHGGFEIEVILKEAGKENRVEFDIETESLNFFKQGELSEAEIKRGAYRPENIINSYAVYHKTLKNGEHKTGKAFHIYRPKIYDADKNWTWGDLQIDERAGKLYVTIPEDWLERAVYPITVDPTIGYTDVGGSTVAIAGGGGNYQARMGNSYEISEDGIAKSIHFHTKADGTVNWPFKGFVNEDDSEGLGKHGQVAITDGADVSHTTSGSWKQLDFDNEELKKNTDYIPNVFADVRPSEASGDVYVYYDDVTTGANEYWEDYSGDFADPSDPWEPDAFDEWRYSLYLTYEEPSVSPVGISSAEAFGTAQVKPGAVILSPAGVASAEAFGNAVVVPYAKILPVGITSGEVFGGAVLSATAYIRGPPGIESAEAFGVAEVKRGSVTVIPQGIASTEAFGTAEVKRGEVTVSPNGITSAEAFGTAQVKRSAITIRPSGIATAEAFGTAQVVPGNVEVKPPGIASAEAFGTAEIKSKAIVTPTGIATAEGFGTAQVKRGDMSIVPTGIASSEAFGTANLKMDQQVEPSGITSEETFGTAVITVGDITISVTGIASAEAFGTATVLAGEVAIEPTGIPSAEAFGSAKVISSAKVEPVGIASAEAFGTASVELTGFRVHPTGIASAEAFGEPTLSLHTQIVQPGGIPSTEAFGGLRMVTEDVTTTVGISVSRRGVTLAADRVGVTLSVERRSVEMEVE